MDNRLLVLYKEIAQKHNVSVEVVINIMDHQFAFTRRAMAMGERNKPETFKTIHLAGLGKFYPRFTKINRYINLNNARKEKADQLGGECDFDDSEIIIGEDD